MFWVRNREDKNYINQPYSKTYGESNGRETEAERFFVKELQLLSDEEDVTFQTDNVDYFERTTDLDNSILRFRSCTQDGSVSIIELEEIRNPDKGVTAIGAWIEWAKCGFLIKF